MPELDFMIIADYVRAEGGVLHMIAAGFDIISTPTVPAVRQVGIGMRITMTPAEAHHAHEIELIYQDADGTRVAEFNARWVPQPNQPAMLPGMRPAIAIPFNFAMPLPAYGRFSLELLIDHAHKKSIDITVAEPPPGFPGVPSGYA
jgi:hypothetical protein